MSAFPLFKRLLLATASLLCIGSLPAEELIQEAKNLSIMEAPGGHYEVKVVDPVHPSRTLSFRLVDRDSPNPGSPTPAVEGGPATIPIPARRIVSLSTTYVGAFDALGAIDHVIAVDDANHIFSKTLRKRHELGLIVEVGSPVNLDLETILSIDPDLVLMTRINPGQQSIEERLRAAGIPVLITGAWKEHEPLGRSEWIKLFGILTGRRGEAFRIFEESRNHYQRLSERVAQSESDRPSVLLSAPYGGVWYMPGGKSFSARFLEDAGADYLWSENESTGSFPVDLESALLKGFKADFWLNPGRYSSLAELGTADKRFRVLPAFRQGEVYNRIARIGPSGANDFWESGSVFPDRVLGDLIAIFHPELLPDHEFYYYRKLR